MLRRLVTIPAVWLAASLLTPLAPALLVLAALLDLARRRFEFPSPRVIFFGLCFAWIESAGILVLAGVFGFTLGRPKTRVEITYAVQRLYTQALFQSVCLALSLKFEVLGDPLVDAGPWVVWVQHTSLVDTLVPGVFLAGRHRLKLRYVLKRELKWGPCLDIAGSWLPNHFVSRSGIDSQNEIAAVRALKTGLSKGEGVLLYPEGTRFTPKKLARALEKIDPRRLPEARKLTRLLPPRLGGAQALLSAEPRCDLLIVGHHGLEGFTSVRQIWAGTLVGTTVQVKFFRIPAAEIPLEQGAQARFVDAAWLKLDGWLTEVAGA